jgi:hypothetical protein
MVSIKAEIVGHPIDTYPSRNIKYASLRYISLIKLVYIFAAVMFYT